jgi:uncharacterized protein YndB with AHSA1/START domain
MRSVTHATFAVERSYPATPARVFAAWADPTAKARWFGGSDWEHELDFRVDGREKSRGTLDGTVYTFSARYQDIVPDERIVYAYDMHMGETRISVSLATVELKPDGDGTTLVFTEQGAFLDGLDDPSQREEGTRILLDGLAKELER